ncbi:MAG: endonuclease/exonuclease/phosphatase family protein [Acidobacteria bacterium]|nr:endonuclease/exonuclease/phosphatase family protein [Acidobacteriota bacterium]
MFSSVWTSARRWLGSLHGRTWLVFYFLSFTAPDALLAQQAPPVEIVPFAAPEMLSFQELVQLSNDASPAPPLRAKLEQLLNTPFTSNEAYYQDLLPVRPHSDRVGVFLRAVFWNIERGLEQDLIRRVLSSPAEFKSRLKEFDPEVTLPESAAEQLEMLQKADLLILNEVDLGMTRTGYNDIARDLAHSLKMNYTYGVEFVEVDKLNLGLEEIVLEDKKAEEELRQEFKADPQRYRGLHGTAILSRYPIANVRIKRLRTCYDWYGKEQEAISELEKAKRQAAKRVFYERVSREVRRGGRMALIADLLVPEAPAQTITVVAVHLENKCHPRCRRQQMREVLSAIRDIPHPVILAGDLNTTGTDNFPTSVRREISKRVRNPKFWAKWFINWFNPISLPRTLAFPSNYFKNHLDPTARHIPLLASNHEAGLFRDLEDFSFADGNKFDFSGGPERTTNATSSTLANSNQRGRKGFKPTFSFQQDYGGLVGQFKLDWFFIKPVSIASGGSYGGHLPTPHFPVTMQELNEAVPGKISDHAPILVDLPLDKPLSQS